MAARPVLTQMAQGQGLPAQHPQLAAAGTAPIGAPVRPASSAAVGSLCDEAIANAAMPGVDEQEFLLSVVSQRNVCVLELMQDNLQSQMDTEVRTGPNSGDSDQLPRVEDVVSGLLSDVSKLSRRAQSRVRRRRRIAVGASAQQATSGSQRGLIAVGAPAQSGAAGPQSHTVPLQTSAAAVPPPPPHTAVSAAEAVLRNG